MRNNYKPKNRSIYLVIGIMMMIVSIVINIVSVIRYDVNILMDSELKVFLTLLDSNPILYLSAIILFFSGFAMIAWNIRK